MIALIAPLLTSSALAATTCCIFIIHQDSGDQFGRWTSCWFRRQSGLRRFFCGAPIAKSMGPRCPHSVSAPGTAVPSHSDEAIESIGGTVRRLGSSSARTRCSARSVTQGAASTLFWCRPCRHSLLEAVDDELLGQSRLQVLLADNALELLLLLADDVFLPVALHVRAEDRDSTNESMEVPFCCAGRAKT